jgi:hypothetical protein
MSESPGGFGLRQPSAAFDSQVPFQSGSGLPQSKTPPRPTAIAAIFHPAFQIHFF